MHTKLEPTFQIKNNQALIHLTPTTHLNKPKKVVKNDLLELLPKMLPSFFSLQKVTLNNSLK